MTGDAPLAGTRVLVPRAQTQAVALADRIRALGGTPVTAPVLTIEAGDRPGLDAAVDELARGDFEVLGLTSPNGVDALADALRRRGHDARALAGVATVACVGPGTASRLWERLRVVADVVPDTATTEGLAAALPPGDGRVLLPRADIATDVLTSRLRDKGWQPVEVVAYRTGRPERLPEDVLAALEAGEVDLLAFGSSSTVRNFVALAGGGAWRGRVVSIGPVTSATCRELGLPVAVEATTHDLDGLVDALVTAAADGSGAGRTVS